MKTIEPSLKYHRHGPSYFIKTKTRECGREYSSKDEKEKLQGVANCQHGNYSLVGMAKGREAQALRYRAVTGLKNLLQRKNAGLRVRKEAVQEGRAPLGLPFSPGMRFGELLFISGQGPIDTSGRLVEGDIKAQTTMTLHNFKKIVEAAGSNMDSVLQTTVYLKDLKEFPGMNEAYAAFFSEPRPARTTVQVADLLLGMRVEIQGIAHIPSRTRG